MKDYLDDFVVGPTAEEMYAYDYWYHDTWESDMEDNDYDVFH